MLCPVPGITAGDWSERMTAGLLSCGYLTSTCLPAIISQWHDASRVTRMGGNPLTVAGAATVLVPFGSSAPCSLLIPFASS